MRECFSAREQLMCSFESRVMMMSRTCVVTRTPTVLPTFPQDCAEWGLADGA